MQLAITVLSKNSTNYLTDIFSTIGSCECSIIELKTSQLSQASACYLLTEGSWNQIAKLETILSHLKARHDIHLQTLRPEIPKPCCEGTPYTLETISLFRTDIVQDLTTYLLDQNVYIEEICASRYQAPYFQSPVFSTKFILSIPPDVRILSLREELLDFCDNLNLDAILEPIKR